MRLPHRGLQARCRPRVTAAASLVLAIALLLPAAAGAATGQLTLTSHGRGGVNQVLRAAVTLTQRDCDASGNCEWYAYVIDQPLRQGPCAPTASTDSGPVAPDRIVDFAPQGVSDVGPGLTYSGPGIKMWSFTVARADIPGRYRLCLYVALPDDTTSNALVAHTTFTPRPARHRRHARAQRPAA